jgi:hypothetical protein
MQDENQNQEKGTMDENESPTCIICLDALNQDPNPCTLSCGHSFHTSCLQIWFTIKSSTCPHCRQESTCHHPNPLTDHLKPYLFDLVAQQKATIRRLEQQVEELQTWQYIHSQPDLMMMMQSHSSPAFSFANTNTSSGRNQPEDIPFWADGLAYEVDRQIANPIFMTQRQFSSSFSPSLVTSTTTTTSSLSHSHRRSGGLPYPSPNTRSHTHTLRSSTSSSSAQPRVYLPAHTNLILHRRSNHHPTSTSNR